MILSRSYLYSYIGLLRNNDIVLYLMEKGHSNSLAIPPLIIQPHGEFHHSNSLAIPPLIIQPHNEFPLLRCCKSQRCGIISHAPKSWVTYIEICNSRYWELVDSPADRQVRPNGAACVDG
jgi:hypothetical protein